MEEESSKRPPGSAPGKADHQPVSEKAEFEARKPPSGRVIYQAIFQEGEEELARTSPALAWSALAAGLSMGFSLAAQGVLSAYLPDAPWQRLVMKLGYGVGFLIVVLGSQQLFTENTLTVMLPLLARKDRKTMLNVLRLWGIVLAANLAGAFAFAWVAGNTPLFQPELKAAFQRVGEQAMAHGFGVTLLRAVVAGWLIALMVWLLPFGESARVWIVLILTWMIGILGSPHIVAGSVDALYLVATGSRSIGDYAGGYLVPTLLGNMIGGISLVAAFGHAQFGAANVR
jgi:formate/nitrite transporter FocA (FNT family)